MEVAVVNSQNRAENNLISNIFIDSTHFVNFDDTKEYKIIIPQDDIHLSFELISDRFIGLDNKFTILDVLRHRE